LFSTKTGYGQLDERIGKTKGNKEHLLKVLVLPEVPLHNNSAELAARAKVKKRFEPSNQNRRRNKSK
jgi:hypothetical protein